LPKVFVRIIEALKGVNYMDKIYIEDHVVPQLFTTAIEAYEFMHKNHAKGKGYDQLETFGLLWGYVIAAKGDQPAKVVATMATVETSALRHNDWVAPNFNSIKAKKEFFGKYWPNVELVGTFHSHPYEDLTEINENKGWRASGKKGDIDFWPHFHRTISPEQPLLAHMIVAITKLNKKGWAYPSRLKGSEELKGYVLSADNRKLWLRCYSTIMVEDIEDDFFEFSDDIELDIPALETRFL
jgi:hypothetical protein